MGMYQYVRELWKQPKDNLGSLWKERLVEWRQGEATTRIERPTRIDRARTLGYKAKEGIIMVRQRLPRGGRMRPKIRKGRRSKHFGRRVDLAKSYQWVAEERAARKYPNCEVLNSYYVAEDGKYFWYEIILVDKLHPQMRADQKYSWLMGGAHTRRAHRGLTSAARKSRGLLNKGKGAEKIRPSIGSHSNRAK